MNVGHNRSQTVYSENHQNRQFLFFFFNGQMRPFVSQMEKLQSFESETQKRIFRGNWSLF